jgi:RNA polymerase sigma factor (sigma-70 family)
MARATSSPILQQIRRLRVDQRARGASDQELLHHLGGRDGEAAFHALVGRHGPMVLGVCRDVLGNEADAEDAFQITFLVLASKVGSIRRVASLSCWLHGVAYRTALKARAQLARRRKHEARASPPIPSAPDDLSWREVRQVMHEELNRLPERFRAPLVLCYLESKTQDEAAAALGLAKGTLRGHLERGRALLRQRLARRGLGPAGVLAAASWPALSPAGVPIALAGGTVRAACAVANGKAASAGVPAHLAAVLEGTMKSMVVGKARGLIWALGVTILVGVGGAAVLPGLGGRVPTSAAAEGPAPAKPETLVKQLGSDEFAEREAAGDKLRSLGLSAVPAVRAGMKNADPEIARRCEELLPRIFADSWAPFVRRFQADKDGKEDFDHPIWRRFKSVAGDNPQSRKIFAEMIENADRVRALQAAECEPEAAGAVYADEMARQLAERLRRVMEAIRNYGYLILKPPAPHRGEFATILFLGSYPAKAAVVPKPEVETSYVEDGIRSTSSVFEAPMRKLFAAWAATRRTPEGICLAMRAALWVESEDCLAVARRVAADAKLPSPTRASAFPVLAQLGNRTDLALLEPLRDDAAVYGQEIGDNPGPSGGPVPNLAPRIVQVRDMAVTMMLALHGKEPSDLAFDYGLMSPGAYVKWQYYVVAGGFRNDTDRAAAHRKASAWLDAQPRADAPPTGREIEEWVKQLGSARYVEREAADRNLSAIGGAARPAVEVGMKGPDAEIARRCKRLFDALLREKARRDGPQ